MKKRTVAITIIAAILVSALLSIGITALWVNYHRTQNVIETGNMLGISWYSESETEFTITTKEQLFELVKLSDFYDFKDQTIYLGADIIINEGNASDWAETAPAIRWKPIKGFAGTFDGQGHSISGLYGRSYGSALALFTNAKYSCTIRDMKLVTMLIEKDKKSNLSATKRIVLPHMI